MLDYIWIKVTVLVGNWQLMVLRTVRLTGNYSRRTVLIESEVMERMEFNAMVIYI